MTTSRTRHAVTAAAILLGGLGTLTAAPPASAAPVAGQVDPCARSSWLAGTTEICRGVLVYRDYVMDDYGAASPVDPTNRTAVLGSLSPTAGDARYPDPTRAGTADLVDLSLRVRDDRLVAVFRLNALFDAGSTIAALAVDADDDPATGGGVWPGLGIRSAGWDVLQATATGDPATNTLTISMPRPSGTRWRVQAVTAKADGTVMNVAFRGTDEGAGSQGSTWWEGEQADVLASGDISRFGARVAVRDLTRGTTRKADHTESGLHLRVFESRFAIGSGEGYSYTPEYGRHGNTGNVCEQEFASLGRFQPYAVYVPPVRSQRRQAARGMQVYLHGCNANHASQIEQPGFQRQFGDQLDRVIVAPLGRGPVGYYSDISEADVLEAIRDADAAYALDDDRWFLSGYSMGGYGTLRLGALYPHLWAGLTNWVGFTGDVMNNPVGPAPVSVPSGGIGNAIDFVGNLGWVPSEHLYAGADELVQVHTATALAQRLDEAGVDHAYFLHPAAEHLTFILLDQWAKEAAASAGRSRVADPPRVRYRTDASLDFPAYGIRHDRAYWVSRIRSGGPGYADVDLTTHACGGSLPQRKAGNGAGTDPLPWVSDTLRTTGGEPLAARRHLTGSLANVSSLRVDARATCLGDGPVHYDITSDRGVAIDLGRGRRIVLDGPGRHTGQVAASHN